MGWKQVELVPIGTIGPTPITPSPKDIVQKIFQVTRSDTTPAVLKAELPADSTITGIKIFGATNSDAATTATIIVTVLNNSGTISTGTAVDVKGSGTVTANVQMSALPNIEPIPLNGDLLVKAVYAETGGASTTGGPWIFSVEYVR